MKYHDIYFEDFAVGRRFETASRTISEADIIAYGKAFAPLPYHTDVEAAKQSMFGGVVAAGLHTASVTFGLFLETGVFSECGMGSPGLEGIRWLKPVRAGDTLRVIAEVTEALPPRREGGRNLIKLMFSAVNQDAETVIEINSIHFVRARPQ